jgi:hypothetical protein
MGKKPAALIADSLRPRILPRLLDSKDPAVRYKAHVLVLGESETTPEVRKLRSSIASSPRSRAILDSYREAEPRGHAYRKWQGPHWTLYQLARIGYPPGDRSLRPLLERVRSWLDGPHQFEFPSTQVIPGQEDRVRHCASQEGYAVWYSIRLGIDDERTREYAARLCRWQWPDGGWNCDKRPEARCSSAVETLPALRGLGLAARAWATSDPALAKTLRTAVDRAANWFLVRRLHFRLRDGTPIRPDWGGPFEKIAHPIVFYDVLGVLMAMAEIGRIRAARKPWTCWSQSACRAGASRRSGEPRLRAAPWSHAGLSPTGDPAGPGR